MSAVGSALNVVAKNQRPLSHEDVRRKVVSPAQVQVLTADGHGLVQAYGTLVRDMIRLGQGHTNADPFDTLTASLRTKAAERGCNAVVGVRTEVIGSTFYMYGTLAIVP
jgi:hypothetical protein